MTEFTSHGYRSHLIRRLRAHAVKYLLNPDLNITAILVPVRGPTAPYKKIPVIRVLYSTDEQLYEFLTGK